MFVRIFMSPWLSSYMVLTGPCVFLHAIPCNISYLHGDAIHTCESAFDWPSASQISCMYVKINVQRQALTLNLFPQGVFY